MDNAKKLIPESYKVDGKEFEMTDGNETYKVKWSSLINEGIVLTSSNKAQINEDMGKMKHLMGFKSQETLGTVKGADRLDENKKFGDVLDKTKKLINESAITEVEEEIDESIEEGEHIKSGMGGSNKGKSRTDKTEVLKNKSKKQRRKADKEATKDINENDVEALQSALGDSPKVAAAAKKVNTRDEKFEAAIAYINNMVGDNDVLKSKIARTLLKKDGSDVVNEFDGDEDEYEYYRRGGRELDDYLDDAEKEARRAKESGIFKDDLPPGPSDEEEQAAQVYEDDLPIPPGPSDEEEQAAQVYEDRFDEVFEGMYEGDDIETLDEGLKNWIAAGLITIGSIAGIGKVIQLDNQAQEAKMEYYQNVLSPKTGDIEKMAELGHEIQDETHELAMSMDLIKTISQEEGGMKNYWADFAKTKLQKNPQDFSVDQSGTIHYTPK